MVPFCNNVNISDIGDKLSFPLGIRCFYLVDSKLPYFYRSDLIVQAEVPGLVGCSQQDKEYLNGTSKPRYWFHVCHLLAPWPWKSYTLPLSLLFLIWKTGIIVR